MSRLDELIAGLCPNGVKYVKLKEVAQISAGGDLPENYAKGQKVPTEQFPYPIYSNGTEDGALYGFSDSYKISKEAVTISARGTLGYHAIRSGKFTPIVRLLTLIADERKITTKFLNYALDVASIGGVSTGIPSLTVPMLEKSNIPLPPLPVQNEIVRILDNFTELSNELSAELSARKKQYEYYKDKLLTFGDCTPRVLIGDILVRTKGTKITAQQMKQLHKKNGELRIFAGGKTIADVDFSDIPEKDVNYDPSIIVKSRGNIEFEYYDKPFSHKNEFWSYHSADERILIKFVYYYLLKNVGYFQQIANSMQMPQISIPVTDKYEIPLPSVKEQSRIVEILDRFDALCNDLTIGLPAEIEARRKQYEYYRDKLLTFQEA